MKSYKPRPEMFQKGLQLSGLLPAEVLYIGDSLTSDVSGAKKVGIRSTWINRNQKTRSSNKDEQPEFIINRLDNILKIILL
ncbi:MAG: HAD family hydrolase [Sporolactobacillus sp.]